ncbi:MAG: hypothetical protein ACRDRP_15720 [Pseudonocardiaceae bacterium]
MIEPDHIEFDLPQLDRTDDPQGGAAAWAVLAVVAALVIGTLISAIWALSL